MAWEDGMPDLAEVRNTVEKIYSAKAKLLQSVPVREELEGKVVWKGLVRIFEIETPEIMRVYAGSLVAGAGATRRVFALQHTEKISSPIAAVRAAIVMEQRRERPLL
jgi:hypothetical protein